MSRALVLAAATGLILLTGCSPDEPTPAPASSSEAPSAPSVPASSPAAEPPGDGDPQSATTPSQAPVPPSQAPAAVTFAGAQQAADHLMAAWYKGDRNAALQAAGPNTVNKIFALPKPAVDKVEGCDSGSEAGNASYAYRCYYLYEGGASNLWINPHPASGWRVENFTQIAD